MREVKYWYRPTREVVDYPSLEIFKTHLHTVLGNLLWLTLLEQGYWSRGLCLPQPSWHSLITYRESQTEY